MMISTVVTFQYDPLNRMTKALIGSTSYGTLTYDALGRRNVLTFFDGSTQTWGYDSADRVHSIAHVFPADTADNDTLTYGYDGADREATRTDSDSDYAYVPTAGSTAYGAPNALNQYTSVGGYTYSYWPEGGLNQSDTLQANYDELGKLTLAYLTTTPGVIDPNNFEYMALDGLGHLYAHAHQTTAGTAFPFIYHSTDGLRPETAFEWQCQQTLPNAPTCTGTRRYILGPDPDERWAFVDTNGYVYSPHVDRQGTVMALSKAGSVLEQYTYDPYGQSAAPLYEQGPSSKSYAYRLTGQRLDRNTWLYDYKARDYSSALGRFMQPDPAGVDQGPNLYEYVGNDPIGAGDPAGECPHSTCPFGSADTFEVAANAPTTVSAAVGNSTAPTVSRGLASPQPTSQISTPNGPARQGADAASMAARKNITSDTPLYRIGSTGVSKASQA